MRGATSSSVILACVNVGLSTTTLLPALRPLVISAPFGNYIQPRGTTPTLGTFTVHDRPGRPWRIVKTVRYYPRLKAWVNRIGLRNPGIRWVQTRVIDERIRLHDKLISIHGFDEYEWLTLLDTTSAMKPMGIELNMSCPNVGHVDWPTDLFSRAVRTGVPIFVKLPPVRYQLMVQHALEQGVRLFHCCNTLPVPAGGLSGAPLKPISLECIRTLRALPEGGTLGILAGGGIYQPQDMDDYAAAGATWFAVGTKAMNPLLLLTHGPLERLKQRADHLAQTTLSSSA